MADNTAPLLAIKDWADHQHYKDRRPPWIKLHATLLTSGAFLQLPEAAQAQLMKLWLLASQMGHPLPNNPKLLAGQIGTTGKVHIAALIGAGFLIETDDQSLAERKQDASTPLAESPLPPRALATEDRVQRTETATPPPPDEPEEDPRLLRREADLAARLVCDADRNAMAVILATCGNKAAWLGEFAGILDGMGGPGVSPEQLGEAMRDYVANGKAKVGREQVLRQFRRYVTTVREPAAITPRRSSRAPVSPGVEMIRNILGEDAA